MNLRAATERDLPAIVGLLAQAQLPTADLAAPGSVQFWLAEDAGAVVGAVGLERHGDAALLRSLVVEPHTRGTGLGVALVARAEAEARAQRVARIVLLTQTAQAFFARRGYATIAREAAPAALRATAEFRSLCPASAVCMTRTLPRAVEVLFLCTGNSCRSILAEATFNHLAPPGWHAQSAGSRPTGMVHPRALALLQRERIPAGNCHSKSWEALPATPDLVVTVCASAAGETCPVYLGEALRAHWGVADPAQATGSDAEIDAAFERAYATLRRRIEALLALPLEELAADRARLRTELDRIGAEVT